MTLVIEAAELAGALKRTKLVGLRGPSPVLISAGGGHADFVADSYDAKVEVSVPILDGFLDPVLLPHDTLARVVSKYRPGPVRVSVEGPKLRLKAQGATSGLFMMDPASFPQRPPLAARANVVSLEGTWAGIRRVMPAADGSAVGWVSDLAIVDGYAYATDRFRVHRTPVPLEDADPLRLPGALIDTIIRARDEPTVMRWDSRHFQLATETTTWTGNLGNVEELLRTAPVLSNPFTVEWACSIEMDRAELRRALDAIMAVEVSDGIYRESAALTFDDDNVLIIERYGEFGDHAVDIEYEATGTPGKVGFNARNLADSLAQLEGDTVKLYGPVNPRGAWWMGDDVLEIAIMSTVL